jgi:GntR family transcriptional regulator / MocR family aminotransferase
MLELTPELKLNSDIPLYSQLYEYIKSSILKGELKAGERLPSIRYLAQYLKVSKNTVVTAYDQLLAEGYISSSDRSGIFVEKLQKEILDKTYAQSFPLIKVNKKSAVHDPNFDYRCGQIDVRNFSFSLWKKVLEQCISSDMSDLLTYGEHQGEIGLRAELAHYLFLSRGVKCSPEQIIIGAGTQQSLSMLCLALNDIGSYMAFEEPGYNGARQVFINNGFEVNPVPLEEDGININELKKSLSKIVYITPSHQFPCGMVMPVAKRLELLHWAASVNGYIIEDDYDGEFRYQGKPIPALQGLDTSGSVIYLGTFSKSLTPSIRISYMVLPERLLKIFKHRCGIYEQPVSRLEQKALQLFIDRGYWHRHIKKTRNIYKKKHDLLLDSITDIMGDAVEVIGKDAGLHILLRVKNDMNELQLIESAYRSGVSVSPTSQYWHNSNTISAPLIFLSFGGIELDNIRESIVRLKKCWLQ